MRKQLVAFMAVVALAAAAHADPFSVSGPAANDVDTNPGTDVVLFAGTNGVITDLNVSVWITGGHMEDFDLYLTSPAGTTVQFRTDFTSPDFYHIDAPLRATFDDEASAPHSDQVFGAVGTFQPYSSLGAFDGEDLLGNWTLRISDEFIPNEGDDLVAWGISGDVRVPEPTLAALLGLGLAGVGLVRRRKTQ
jgi:Proprotein convertase P-domain